MSGLQITVDDGLQIIKFNKEKKKNAVSVEAYRTIKKALEEAATNKDIFFTVLTGEGDFFSSGVDVTDPEGKNVESSGRYSKELFAALIDYPKLLIAVVNGPAIGVAVTMLGHCDIIYASDRATFLTPFSNLGLCVEGSASYAFSKILGQSKADEMLYTGHVMTANEALNFNFVAEVIPHLELNKIWTKIRTFKNVSRHSIIISKKMVKDFNRTHLHEANQKEIENAMLCFRGDDFKKRIKRFLSRKSKL